MVDSEIKEWKRGLVRTVGDKWIINGEIRIWNGKRWQCVHGKRKATCRDNMNFHIDVYWDLENIRPSKDSNIIDITNQIRSCLQQFGIINKKNIYIDSQSLNEAKTKRADMCLSGWNIIDTPHRNKKESVDKKIIMDVLSSIITRDQSHKNMMICIITSDSDFAELFSRIRDFGVHTCIFYGKNPSQLLLNCSEYSFNWDDDIIKRIDDASLYHDIEVDEDELAIFAQRLADRDIDVSKIETNDSEEVVEREHVNKYPEVNYIPKYSPTNKLLSDKCCRLFKLMYDNKDHANCIHIDTIATRWYKSQDAKEFGKKACQSKLRLMMNELLKNNLLKRVTKKQKLTLKQKKGEVVKFTTEGIQFIKKEFSL